MWFLITSDWNVTEGMRKHLKEANARVARDLKLINKNVIWHEQKGTQVGRGMIDLGKQLASVDNSTNTFIPWFKVTHCMAGFNNVHYSGNYRLQSVGKVCHGKFCPYAENTRVTLRFATETRGARLRTNRSEKTNFTNFHTKGNMEHQSGWWKRGTRSARTRTLLDWQPKWYWTAFAFYKTNERTSEPICSWEWSRWKEINQNLHSSAYVEILSTRGQSSQRIWECENNACSN